MSSSSQLENLSANLVDDILISASGTGVSSDTISITSSAGVYSYNSTYDFTSVTGTNSVGTYTISTGMSPTTIDTITISNIDTSQFTFNFPEEWTNAFPDWARVQDMCKKYPGLKIAFDNFKVFYEMVKDDYDNPTPKK